MSEIDDIEQERYGLEFDISKSMRYHAHRRSFWETTDRLNKILTFISGAGVLVAFLAEHTKFAKLLAFAVALFSVVDIVVDFGKNARLHDSLYRRFSLLLQQLVALPANSSLEDLRSIKRGRLEIEMDEPTALDLLERRSAGEQADADGAERRPAWKLNRWQIALSQFDVLPTLRNPHRSQSNKNPAETRPAG